MSFLSRRPSRPGSRDGDAGRDDEYGDYDYAPDGYVGDEDESWSPGEYFSPEGIRGRRAGGPSMALATLVRRYLSGHAPARPEDLAKWAGIPLGEARAGFGAIDDELVQVGEGLIALGALADAPLPTPRLLGPFDPIMHGWISREPFVGRHSGVVTTNGIFRPVALVEGRVVATWGLPGGQPTISPLEPLSARPRRALSDDGADVQRFLGLPQRPVHFD